MHISSHAAERRLELVSDRISTLHGAEVRAQCFVVRQGAVPRHEIILDSGPHRAVVDVPRGADPQPILARAVDVFAASMRARP